jgi:hypothetical protein
MKDETEDSKEILKNQNGRAHQNRGGKLEAPKWLNWGNLSSKINSIVLNSNPKYETTPHDYIPAMINGQLSE